MIAVDTNVLIYACDQSDPRSQAIALDLIAATRNDIRSHRAFVACATRGTFREALECAWQSHRFGREGGR